MQKKINWKTWACQLFFGYPLGTEYHLAGENLSESDQESLPIKPMMLPRVTAPISDFSEAVTSTVELFLASVEESLKKHKGCEPVVFLSGGWDSRAILCALKKVAPLQHVTSYTTSYDAGNNKEEVFAKLVAQALGVPHKIIPLTENYYQQSSEETIVSSNFTSKMHIWMQDFLTQINLTKKSVNLDGYAGDLFFRGMRQELGDEDLSPEDPRLFDRFAIFHPQSVVTNPIYKMLEILAREALAEELSRYSAENRILNFVLNNRGARGVAYSIRLQRKFINVALPFLSQPLIENAVNIDPQIRLNPDFYPSILTSLNPKVSLLPSTNSKNLQPTKYSEVPQIKYKPENIDWMLSDIKQVSGETDLAGGILDWYTINPSRTKNSKYKGRDLQRHLRALESVHLYALWYRHHQDQLKPKQNILEDLFQYKPAKLLPTKVTLEEDYDSIIKKYLMKIGSVTASEELLFNMTMDVEAFGINDIYSNHTAHKDLIEKLIYSDFGEGSDICNLFFKNKVPCTYFIESYSLQWKDEETFKTAVGFFAKPYNEVGLHCHAFSLPDKLRQELNLPFDWAMLPNHLASVFSWGKQRLEKALGDGSKIKSYRSGRLDIYPNWEYSLQKAGFEIDSSLLDGVDNFYYQERQANFGNGIFRLNELTQIPVTSFRVGEKTRSFDFNGASFEQICEIIYQAIKQNLPCLTLIMHSWSFSQVHQLRDFGKAMHFKSDPVLVLKFYKLLEFIEAIPMVKMTTISQAASILQLKEAGAHPATDLNTSPPILSVYSKRQDNCILTKSIAALSKINGKVEYAFYLLHKGERIATRWYLEEDQACFSIEDSMLSDDLVIRAFIKVVGDKKPLTVKSSFINPD